MPKMLILFPSWKSSYVWDNVEVLNDGDWAYDLNDLLNFKNKKLEGNKTNDLPAVGDV